MERRGVGEHCGNRRPGLACANQNHRYGEYPHLRYAGAIGAQQAGVDGIEPVPALGRGFGPDNEPAQFRLAVFFQELQHGLQTAGSTPVLRCGRIDSASTTPVLGAVRERMGLARVGKRGHVRQRRAILADTEVGSSVPQRKPFLTKLRQELQPKKVARLRAARRYATGNHQR